MIRARGDEYAGHPGLRRRPRGELAGRVHELGVRSRSPTSGTRPAPGRALVECPVEATARYRDGVRCDDPTPSSSPRRRGRGAGSTG
ncbi:hypothetical protein HBB16_15280 [Pseudonocardia sp. MCCB 268]|nr:hypothetical protein [Pseudonocardia cytotoxica]